MQEEKKGNNKGKKQLLCTMKQQIRNGKAVIILLKERFEIIIKFYSRGIYVV